MRTAVKSWKKTRWLLLSKGGLRIDDSPAPRGYISAFLVDQPENQFFYNREYLKEYLGVTNNQKSSVPGHGYFSKLEQFESLHCEKGELYMEYRRMSCKERNGQLCQFCEKDETTSVPLPTRHHIPTMASYQTSIISLRVQPPLVAVSRTTSSLELRLSDCLRKVN